MNQHNNLGWNSVELAIHSITKQIKESDFEPDYIVGIVRGGAIPAVLLSHKLNLPVHMLHWSTRDVDSSVVCNEMNCWIPEDILNGKKVLIVEDIIDSGKTILEILQDWQRSIHKELPLTNIRICSIVYNESQKVSVDFFYEKIDRNTNTDWYVFPWEK